MRVVRGGPDPVMKRMPASRAGVVCEGNLRHVFSFGFRPTFGRKPPMRVVRGRPDPVVKRMPANRAEKFDDCAL